ncbi:MAG: PDZ domain-containing protein [Anaerolineaceae bacterium]
MHSKTKNFFVISLFMILITACSPLATSTPATGLPGQQTDVAAPTQAVESPSPTAIVQAPVDSNNTLAAYQGTLESIYEQVNPSVVNIQVTSKITADQQVPFTFPNNSGELPTQQALGSGFVWDTNGYIVTNNHVIDGANRIVVTFADDGQYEATLVGADKDSDLAVIKVDAPKDVLKPVSMADSNSVKVGQLAVAIGNPYGLNGTMTVGIVSAVDRSLSVDSSRSLDTGSYTIPDIIQTDAAINPGNSGGVLVNTAGAVIGVTSAIESTSGSNAGIGFAIPTSIVTNVVPELIKNGSYAHPWVGISGTTLNIDIINAMNLPENQRGILVVDVVANGPADKAGLLGSGTNVTISGQQARVGGDIITAIDGQTLNNFEELVSYLASSTRVGQKVTLTILRDGKEQTLDLTLEKRPDSSATSTTVQNAPTGSAWLGITGGTMIPEIADSMGLDQNTQGVLVVEVQSGSPADQSGLKGSFKKVDILGQSMMVGGDVITKIDGKAVTGIQDLREEIAKLEPGQEVTLTLLRNGNEMEVKVTLAEQPSN